MPSWVSFCSLQGNCIRVQDGPQQESWHSRDSSLADARLDLSCSPQWHPCDMEIFIQVMQPEWASGQTPFPKDRLLALKGNSLQTAWMLCLLNLKNLTNFCQLPSEGWAAQVTSLRNTGGQLHTTWCGGWGGVVGGLKSWVEVPQHGWVFLPLRSVSWLEQSLPVIPFWSWVRVASVWRAKTHICVPLNLSTHSQDFVSLGNPLRGSGTFEVLNVHFCFGCTTQHVRSSLTSDGTCSPCSGSEAS